MPHIDKLLKSFITSSNSTLDQLLQSEEMKNPENLDISLAIRIGNAATACTHFTHHKMINPSFAYKFANNPGVDSCSHPLIVSFSPPNTLVPCPYIQGTSSCPHYNPDYSIIKKVVASNNIYYYLTKFKDHQGSYFYSVYDSNANAYLNLNYTDIKDSDLDSYALEVFINFLSDSMIEYVDSDLCSVNDQIKSNKVSYLSTILS